MSLPDTPPRYSDYRDMVAPLKQGTEGWPAYAVQRVVSVAADGVWGPVTDKAVRSYQRSRKLTVDGIVGPKTQAFILNEMGGAADIANGLPVGVGYGFAMGEGGGVLAATNWSQPGGVDCGPAQWRVAGPPFAAGDLRFAFDAKRALQGACERLRARQKDILGRGGWWRTHPRIALKAAVLAHNWPVGSSEIVRSTRLDVPWWRRVSRPDDPATWVEGFTRAEWCREYAKRILAYTA